MAAVAASEETWTNQVAWVHQCALMRCGYHEIGPGRRVAAWCDTWNPDFGQWWTLIVSRSPWSSDLDIAGYVASAALDDGSSQHCDFAGEGGHSMGVETWARSCTSITCGYGVIPGAWHNVAAICQSIKSDDGYTWVLVLDHDNTAKDLAGFVRSVHVPAYNPNTPLCFL